MPLDPQAAALIASLAGGTPVEQMTLEESRAALEERCRLTAGMPREVAHVSVGSVPGPGGAIRTRTYVRRGARPRCRARLLPRRRLGARQSADARHAVPGAGQRAAASSSRSTTAWRPSTRSRPRSTTAWPPRAGSPNTPPQLGIDPRAPGRRRRQRRWQPGRGGRPGAARRGRPAAGAISCSSTRSPTTTWTPRRTSTTPRATC